MLLEGNEVSRNFKKIELKEAKKQYVKDIGVSPKVNIVNLVDKEDC